MVQFQSYDANNFSLPLMTYNILPKVKIIIKNIFKTKKVLAMGRY